MIAAMMALGKATHQIAADPLLETGVSQMFVTMNPACIRASPKAVDRIADEIVASVQNSTPATAGKPVRYPGEQTLQVRAENTELGLPVEAGDMGEDPGDVRPGRSKRLPPPVFCG